MHSHFILSLTGDDDIGQHDNPTVDAAQEEPEPESTNRGEHFSNKPTSQLLSPYNSLDYFP